MQEHFPQWSSAFKFNKLFPLSHYNYVLLITETHSFDLVKDLKRTLKITKKPIRWFVESFKTHGVRVEYGTIFSKSEFRRFGPASRTFSEGVVKNYLDSKYSREKIFVCPPGFTKKMPFQSINPGTLTDKLLGERD